LRQGDYLALLSAGAYGSVMASNYNSRALPAEVLVRQHQATLVRERQKLADIWALERQPSWLK
jgi:diaminopimelate decarboxylase